MTDSKKFRNMDSVERLEALLTVAQSQAKRSRLAMERLEREAINDYAMLSLARAIYVAKDSLGLSWGNFTANLNNPCSEEMLRKIASRAKNPSPKTFSSIKNALITLSNKRGFDLPTIEDIRESL
ncbi:MAG: hypothetical protein ACPLYF_04525 [Fervidobacterium sp.]